MFRGCFRGGLIGDTMKINRREFLKIAGVIAITSASPALIGEAVAISDKAEHPALEEAKCRKELLEIADEIAEILCEKCGEHGYLNDCVFRKDTSESVQTFLNRFRGKGRFILAKFTMDETNNTPEIIDDNNLRADLEIQFTHALNIDRVNFSIAKTYMVI